MYDRHIVGLIDQADTTPEDHNGKTYPAYTTPKEEAHTAHSIQVRRGRRLEAHTTPMVTITSLQDMLMFRADIARGVASGTTIIQDSSLVATIDLSINTNNDVLPMFAALVITLWVEILFALTAAIVVVLAIALDAALTVDTMAEQILAIAAQVTAIVTARAMARIAGMLAIRADQDLLAIVAARTTEFIL